MVLAIRIKIEWNFMQLIGRLVVRSSVVGHLYKVNINYPKSLNKMKIICSGTFGRKLFRSKSICRWNENEERWEGIKGTDLRERRKKKQTNKRKTDHLQVMFSIHFREFVAFAFGRVTPSTGGLIISRFAGSIVVLSRLVGRSVGRFIQIQFVSCIQFHRNDETYATDTKKTLFVSRLCVSLVSLLLGAALVRSIPCFSLGASHCPMCCGSLSN